MQSEDEWIPTCASHSLTPFYRKYSVLLRQSWWDSMHLQGSWPFLLLNGQVVQENPQSYITCISWVWFLWLQPVKGRMTENIQFPSLHFFPNWLNTAKWEHCAAQVLDPKKNWMQLRYSCSAMSSVHLTTWNTLNVPLSLSLPFWCKKLWGLTSRCYWVHMSAEKPCQTQTLLTRPFESLESCGSKIWIHSIYAGLHEFLPFVDWDFPETKKAWMRLESLFGGPE